MSEEKSEAYYYPLLIKDILEYAVFAWPNQEIVYRDIKRFSYSEFYERVKRVAGALKSLGIGFGDRVGVVDWDTYRYLELYFAVPSIGAVLHKINLRLAPEIILYTINHAEDKILIIKDEFVPIFEKVRDKLPKDIKFILASDAAKFPLEETKLQPAYDYEELINKSSPYEFPTFDENTVATTFYTTGTTGLPKGVLFTHRQLVLHTLAAAVTFAFPSEAMFKVTDVSLNLVPYFHAHSWGIPYIAILLGLKTLLPGRYDWDLMLEMARKEGKPEIFSACVPTILWALVNHPKAEEYRDTFSRWKFVIGGDTLPKGLAEKARALGARVNAGYGLSESCPVLTIAFYKPYMLEWSEDKKLDVRIRTGHPAPLVKLKVCDEHGNEVPKDWKSTGEIVVRAPWLTQEYYKDPEKTKELWRGGWMHTGDIAIWNEEGYIHIVGRSKFLIKSGGEWISPVLIEEILSTHPAVLECAVVPAPHSKWGERPVALVVLRPEYSGKVSEEEFKQYLNKAVQEGKLTKWSVPDRVLFVNSIPKTSVGKIDRLTLTQQYKEFKLG